MTRPVLLLSLTSMLHMGTIMGCRRVVSCTMGANIRHGARNALLGACPILSDASSRESSDHDASSRCLSREFRKGADEAPEMASQMHQMEHNRGPSMLGLSDLSKSLSHLRLPKTEFLISYRSVWLLLVYLGVVSRHHAIPSMPREDQQTTSDQGLTSKQRMSCICGSSYNILSMSDLRGLDFKA